MKNVQDGAAYRSLYCTLNRKYDFSKEKRCLRCGGKNLGYCEHCYQKLIGENAKLQLEHKNISNFKVHIEGMRNGKQLLEKYINDSILKDEIRKKLAEAEKEYNEIHAKHYRDGGISEARAEAKIEAYKELLNTKEEK